MNTLSTLFRPHPLDRIALLAGTLFFLTGMAYLIDDYGLLDLSEGVVAGGVVIVLGIHMLLIALSDGREAPAPVEVED